MFGPRKYSLDRGIELVHGVFTRDNHCNCGILGQQRVAVQELGFSHHDAAIEKILDAGKVVPCLVSLANDDLNLFPDFELVGVM